MPQPSIEERYDPAVAERILGTSMGGLQAYLGIEHVRFEPGRLWCRATVRDEHLTPFGNCHGGAIACIVDHLTGTGAHELHMAKTPEGSSGLASMRTPDIRYAV